MEGLGTAPSDHGLPSHITAWRTGQFEAVEWGRDLKGIGILAAPTGSGKTGIARGIARYGAVVALCQTKLLQETVYKEHGFTILQGKSNYPCILGLAETVETCPHGNKMKSCPEYHQCQYIAARERVKASPWASLNYALFLTAAYWLKDSPPQTLILDECHLLPDITLDYVGAVINQKAILNWGLPRPPIMLADGNMDISRQSPPALDAVTYLRQVGQIMDNHVAELRGRRDAQGIKSHNRAFRLGENAKRTADWIEKDPLLWFVEGDQASFRAKPFTARYHWPNLFNRFNATLLMSATVGDFKTLAEEIGTKDFVQRRVPSRFGPERKPVVALDCPRLSYRSDNKDFDHQAQAIAEAIKAFDPTWSGVIHVNRKDAAPNLGHRLARLGLQDRIWVAPQTKRGTGEQFKLWEEHKMKKGPGQLAITWAWHEGVDLGDEKICICAKVPFPSLGDKYETARFNYSRRFYSQRAAWDLQQQLGRTRRGREEDYDTEDEVRQFVAIADSNWSRVKGFMDEDFRESIVDVKEVV